MKVLHQLLAFNRGIMSRLTLARIDLKRAALAAETMVNWMPRALGSMMLRPGLQYVGGTRSNAAAAHLSFVFAVDDTAIIELTNLAMRVRVNDAIITRPSVSTAVTNGAFTSDVSGWTDSDEAGATSAWGSGGYLSLTGTGTNAAIRDQQVTVVAGDQNKEHALALYIVRGVVTIKIGSTQGGEEYVTEKTLKVGYHSIAFTPTGNFWIRLSSLTAYASLVDYCTIAAAGDMVVTTPWATSNLQNVRFDQSGDVVFCACKSVKPMRIERQGTRSWSVVEALPSDGPFMVDNTGPIRLTASALSGNITLTASKSLFRSTHVGALFRLSSLGQQVTASISAQDTWTGHIRVTGVGAGRTFSIILSGTWSATVTLQRSIEEPGDWTDVITYTTNTSATYTDSLDNQVAYYRIGVKTGGYTSGTVSATLTYSAGSISGIAQVTGYTSATSVSAAVLKDMGGITSTPNWAEGEWSGYRGYPSAVALFDGRLWWAGKDGVWGSVSDAYDSHDDTLEGDSGPISRTIGSGPVDTINWLSAGQNLMVGGQGAEYIARSSSLDEPMTPTNFGIKLVSSQGSSNVRNIKIDTNVVFVHRNGSSIYAVEMSDGGYSYTTNSLVSVVPEIGEPSIVRIAVQRQPDTRVHCVRSDGTVAMMIFDRAENITCWLKIETDGDIEDAIVLPSAIEDSVYYVINRTINGSTVRYLEKWALESECVGRPTAKHADSFYLYSGSAVTTITGLSHLESETVVVWGWNTSTPFTDQDGNTIGKDLGTFVVSSGQITGLASAVTNAVVGLPYTAQFKSAKLAIASQIGAPLTQRKRIDHVGLVLADTHAQGLQYGQDFSNLDNLPLVEAGRAIDVTAMWTAYDSDSFELNGTWDTDARLCLQAAAPRPCTVLAAVVGVAGHDKY